MCVLQVMGDNYSYTVTKGGGGGVITQILQEKSK